MKMVKESNCIGQFIRKLKMSNANPAKISADVNEIISKNLDEGTVNFPYRELISSLLFSCSVSRLGICFK